MDPVRLERGGSSLTCCTHSGSHLLVGVGAHIVHCLKEAGPRDGFLGINNNGLSEVFFKGAEVGREIQPGDVKSNLTPYDRRHFNWPASVYEQTHQISLARLCHQLPFRSL